MDSKRYATILELLDTTFAQYSDLPAYTCMGHTMTFKEIDQLSRRFASYLQNHTDLEPGDRIAVQLPNVLQFPVVLYGAIRAGLIVVNTNPQYTSRELLHQLQDSEAKMLVTYANVAGRAAEILEQTGVETVLVTEVGDLLPPMKRLLVNFVVRRVKKMVPAYDLGKKEIPLLTALDLGEDAVRPVAVQPESVLVLQYTGGTTGVSKGAMLSHANLCANVDQVLTHMSNLFTERSEVIVAALPLYHIFAFNLHAFCAFSKGAHNILIPNPRDVPAFVKALRGQPVSAFIAVNTLYNLLARDKEFAKLDFSNVKTSAAGGMAVTESVSKLWLKVTGSQICEGYGLTETSPVLITNPDNAIKPGTIGTPVKDTEILIVDDQGNPVPDGEPGELWAKGPQVTVGYWRRPETNEEAFSPGGWFKTGDIAVRQSDGYYRIVDRKKDMILVSGFNVYPNEVEDVASQHPEVIEAAALGVPSECSGEAVKLFVVTTEKGVTEEELIAHCRKSLTSYKVPKIIEFRDSLPKSNVGKILRKDLRE